MTLIVADVVVGARQAARLGTGIFTTSQPPPEFTENATKRSKCPVSGCCVEERTWLMPGVTGQNWQTGRRPKKDVATIQD